MIACAVHLRVLSSPDHVLTAIAFVKERSDAGKNELRYWSRSHPAMHSAAPMGRAVTWRVVRDTRDQRPKGTTGRMDLLKNDRLRRFGETQADKYANSHCCDEKKVRMEYYVRSYEVRDGLRRGNHMRRSAD